MSQGPDDLHLLRAALMPKLLSWAVVQAVVLVLFSISLVTALYMAGRVSQPLNAVSDSGRVIVLEPMDSVPLPKKTPAKATPQKAPEQVNGAANG